jgi:hypothetical protein
MQGIIRSGCMWAHSIEQQNDYTEVRYAASVMRAHIERAYAVEPDALACELFLALRRQMATIFLGNLFVLSYSGDGDELGMWRLYADRGTGFSFGFPLHAAKEWPGTIIIAKCQYDFRKLDLFCSASLIKVRELYLAAVKSGCNSDVDGIAAMFFRHIAWFATIFKPHVWADEQEWRIVFHRGPEHHKKRDDERSYIDVPPSGSFPIEAICAGPNCDAVNSIRSLRELMAKTTYKSVPLYMSQHAEDSKTHLS